VRTREQTIRELAGLVKAGRSPSAIQAGLGLSFASIDRYLRDAIAAGFLPEGLKVDPERFMLRGHLYGESGATPEGLETTLIYGDLHCPFEDKRSIQVVCQIAEDLKPDHLIENGDGVDCFTFSVFSKDPERAKTFQTERETHRTAVAALRSACPSETTFSYIGGEEDNHFMRFVKEIVWGKELHDMPELQPARILYLEDHEYQEGPVFIRNTFRISHGIRFGENASKLSLRDHMTSGLQNHSHRLDTYYRTTPSSMYVFAQNGHLSDVEQAYKRNPNWQQGFSILYMMPNGRFHLEQVPIVGHKAIFRGNLYAA